MDPHHDFPSSSTFMLDSSQDNVMDIDFVQLFLDGCWVETTADQYNILHSPAPSSSFNFLPSMQQTNNINNRLTFDDDSNPNSSQPQDTLNLWGNPPQLFDDNNDLNKAWWIPPVPTMDSADPLSVKMRLARAISRFRDSTKDRNVLIQIWVPIRSQGKNVLSTTGQPFTVDPECKSLEYYRHVSENYQFPAEENSKESVGLPGRVYLNKMPEWTPDVKLFKSTEYPRIGYAQQYNVQGSIALPVFERGSGNCLGVVEIVTTTQKINYRSGLEQVRKALEAFDFRSAETCNPCSIKACNGLYRLALPDIVEVLTSICRTHRLPLAQTWAPCVERDKDKSLRSCTNNACCFSILGSAFYAADPQILEFHEACSDHNLYKGQGVVGEAFTTEKPCFEADVTRYTKTEYPLSHHAKTFGLRAAVAVRLRSVHTVSTEFVLEFFLPTDCQSKEAQRKMLAALSYSLQQAGQNLRTLTGLELKEDVLLAVKEAVHASKGTLLKTKEFYQGDSSGCSMGSRQKGKGVFVYKKEPEEELNVTTPSWDNFEKETLHPQQLNDFERRLQDSARKSVVENGGDSSSLTAQRSSAGSRRTGEKRRTKTEKTISLQVLRQYFAGSLKDAAKNIGVCPTTLKRICRQHGITRWPSRKIKKVGHSLRKIQLVIDSVQGAEGALQIGNFYSSYPELSSPNVSGATPFSSLNNVPQPDHQLKQPNLQREDSVALFSLGGTSSKSPSSSCSQSSSSSLCCSYGTNQLQAPTSNDLLGGEEEVLLKRARSDAQLHAPKQEEGLVLARAQSQKALLGPQHGAFGKKGFKEKGGVGAGAGAGAGAGYKVKVTYGEEKVRFSLQEKWGFRDVEEEIRKKFNIEDISRMDVKYLDDDSEWVLLTCDADLEECIDICKSCKRRTIKMCVHVKCQSNIGSSYGSIGRFVVI